MDLNDYLISKKIDPEKFANAEPERFRIFTIEFKQLHPDSFTAQKLFLLNQLRRTYTVEKNK